MTLLDRAIAVRAGLSALSADRLSLFRWAVRRMAQAFALFALATEPIVELLLRGPNGTGKSYVVAVYVVGCAQKRRELDGVPLPQWAGPVECVQVVLDYEQHKLSVGPAYLRALGSWPHRPVWDGEVLKTLYVMPAGGDPNDESDWSQIVFFSEKNRQTGMGVRGDVVAFDEPPVMKILRELRKAAHAWRRCIIIIGMTPTDRRTWAPVLEDYGETPRRTLMRKDVGAFRRAECRWSLDEVADWLLPPARKAEMRAIFSLEPDIANAREHGDYCNEVTKPPWGLEGTRALLEMRAVCYPGEPVEWPVSVEDANGIPRLLRRVKGEMWRRPADSKGGCVVVDPASGVNDGRHHQAGIHVREWETGDLLFRWAGFMSSYSVGCLAGGLAKQYQRGEWAPNIDIEMMDTWGPNVVRGVEQGAHVGGLLLYEMREMEPGAPPSREVGFRNTGTTKGIIIGQVQQWADAAAAGVEYGRIYSLEAIDNILAMELDVKGKVVAGDGLAHGLDVILTGQGLRRTVRRDGQYAQEPNPRPKTEVERLLERVKQEEYRREQNGYTPWEPAPPA